MRGLRDPFLFFALSLLFVASLLAEGDRWDGHYYRTHSNIQHCWARDLLKMHPFTGEERVLDVGCGDGTITSEIAQQVPDGFVMGVDPSEQMIGSAEEIFDPEFFANLQFEIGKAETLSFEGKFDLITAFTSLHWVEEQSEALTRIHRSLRPGGRFLACLPMEGYLTEAIMATTASPRWKERFQNFVPPGGLFKVEEYKNLVVRAGFTPQRIRQREWRLAFEDRDELLGWMAAWLPELEVLQKHDRGQFLQDIFSVLAHLHPDVKQSDGSIVMPQYTLEVVAKKRGDHEVVLTQDDA